MSDIDHVISRDEGVINSNEFNVISLQSNPSHQAPDPSKSFTIFIIFKIINKLIKEKKEEIKR